MQERLNYMKIAPELIGAVLNLKKAVDRSGLDHRLIHLVNLRASRVCMSTQ